MRIMLDTNILVSTIIGNNGFMPSIFKHIRDNHTIALSQYTIFELCNTINNKFIKSTLHMRHFMRSFNYELVVVKHIDKSKHNLIRDLNDLPILIAAIESNVDILITGDKDFHAVAIDTPRILTARQYHDEFMC